ncbi:MAG: hypothetical protein AVW06_04865 [Hadesarchaea archaeon DG-33-1]|nr:MAG: hypothetical protein AVW06_04865 [Hadesarchaea archaeon DG-33-1]
MEEQSRLMIKVEKWLEDNPLSRVLQERSHINPDTFQTLLIFYWSKGITFEKLANELKIQRPGAWKRCQKGLNAIIRSFYTIELAIYAGILDAEIVELLAQDLHDYAALARGEEDLGDLQNRIEERLVRLTKIAPTK